MMCNAVLVNNNFWVMVSWYPLTLRRAGEKGEPGLLGVSSLDDELVGSLLCASGLVTILAGGPVYYKERSVRKKTIY